MKLHEITIPMDVDTPFDDMVSRDNEDSMPHKKDTRHTDRERIPKTARKNSNVKKAQRIRNAVQTLKRERSGNADDNAKEYDVDQGETNPTFSASHGTSFLNR